MATFTNLKIDQVGSGYTLSATAAGLAGTTTTAFDIVASNAATGLVFTVQPSDASPGAIIAPAVEVTARDAQGNPATGFTGDVTIAIGTNPAGGTLEGTTTVAAVAGVATFSTLSIDQVGMGYTLAATAVGLTPATSAAFTIAVPTSISASLSTVTAGTDTIGACLTPCRAVHHRSSLARGVRLSRAVSAGRQDGAAA